MSQVYNLEPPTKGQVVLRTSYGDIEVELWPKEAPRPSQFVGPLQILHSFKLGHEAVRNFTQLCMEGYYNNSIFHRVIKDFMIQGADLRQDCTEILIYFAILIYFTGEEAVCIFFSVSLTPAAGGDPTGTGSGGESIYGRPFKNEFHSRLKFNHRGLVACANEAGKADSNGSQFFITTERCDHLDRQNTIFGRVSGDTIFTVLRMQDVEVDDHDCPVDPPTITSCEILLPPFDDMVPRTTPEEKRAQAAAATEAKRLADVRQRKQHGKRLNVLSFGDDVEEDEQVEPDAATVRFRSAHEILRGDALLENAAIGVHDEHVAQLQERLAAEKKAETEQDQPAVVAEASGERDSADEADAFAESMRTKVKTRSTGQSRATAGLVDRASEQTRKPGGGTNRDEGQWGQRVGADKEGDPIKHIEESTFLSNHKKLVAQYKKQKLSRADRQSYTLSKLKDFKSKLKNARSCAEDADAASQAPSEPVLDVTAYNGKVNKKVDHRSYMPASWRIDSYLDESDDDATENLTALARHRMVWDGNDGVADPTARKHSVDDYKVVDPLIEAGKAAFNLKTQKAKKRGNEWAGRANI